MRTLRLAHIREGMQATRSNELVSSTAIGGRQQVVTTAPTPASTQLAPGLERVDVAFPQIQTAKQPPLAKPGQAPRQQDAGNSPLASSSLAEGAAGANSSSEELVAPQSGGKGGPLLGQSGAGMLPQSAGLIGFSKDVRYPAYLEQARMESHIVPAHITDQPQARGKRTTTWWPVHHSASGTASMTMDDVQQVILDAMSKGRWQNAPKGTRLAVYDLPADEAKRFGVSQVKVSAAPDGRVLSAYPSAGSNVLAVREAPADPMAQQQPAALAQGQAGLNSLRG